MPLSPVPEQMDFGLLRFSGRIEGVQTAQTQQGDLAGMEQVGRGHGGLPNKCVVLAAPVGHSFFEFIL